ncbi:MAG: DUF3088 domain-containing protein [Pseudomonadota bacterium]
MKRDKLIILEVDFDDPAFPEQRFFCWHCVLMEGIFASFPQLKDSVDLIRIAWPQPREEVIALIGEPNQSLPVLILADDAPDEIANGNWNGQRFVSGKDEILAVLSSRHGIPQPHP